MYLYLCTFMCVFLFIYMADKHQGLCVCVRLCVSKCVYVREYETPTQPRYLCFRVCVIKKRTITLILTYPGVCVCVSSTY